MKPGRIVSVLWLCVSPVDISLGVITGRPDAGASAGIFPGRGKKEDGGVGFI